MQSPKFLDFTKSIDVLPIVKVLPLSGTRSRAVQGSGLQRDQVNKTGNQSKDHGYDNLSTICAAATHQAKVDTHPWSRADESLPLYFKAGKISHRNPDSSGHLGSDASCLFMHL